MNRRLSRVERMKRNRKARRIRFYSLIVILVTLSAIGFKFIGQKKGINEAVSMDKLSKGEVNYSSQVLVPRTEHKDLGDIESIIEYGPKGLIGVHYPTFGKDNIDRINKELVSQYIEEFKSEVESNSFEDDNHNSELSIDYEVYSGPNNIVSINFNIMENSSYMAHPDERIITKSYDLSNDREVGLDDIMNGDYLKHISEISESYFTMDENYKDNIESSLFKEGIYPSMDNYSNFTFKEDKLVIMFSKYQLFSGNFGMPSVEISYSQLKDYIKPELFSVFTKEKASGKTDIDSKKPTVDISVPKRVLDPNKPMIALSFDDGPNKKTTIPILDILKEYDSAATFFILGNRVSNNVDILGRMLEEGSEIGNHSYNHKELTKISSEELAGQINDTQNAVIDST